MMKIFFKPLVFFFILLVLFTSCKEKIKKNTDGNETKNYAVVIENGATTVEIGQSISYNAYLIDSDGNIITSGDISWSSSNTQIATFSGNSVSLQGEIGMTTVTCTISYEGAKYSATIPLGVVNTTIFAVLPDAIVYSSGSSIQLETIYLGHESPTYTFESSNTSVATVNSEGKVTFVANGECVITVTCSLQPENKFYVPVLVIDPPTVNLPVAKINVSPEQGDIFKQETIQYVAKAYDIEENEVNEAFTWTTSDPNIATVDANGLVTGISPGKAKIKATAKGIIGFADVFVKPDTIVIVTPFFAELTPGSQQQYTAVAYNTKTGAQLSGVNFTWNVLTFGISMFDIATIDQNGLLKVKNDAMLGMTTLAGASITNNDDYYGVTSIIVSECNCGTYNSNVGTIDVDESDVNLSVGNTSQINATVYDMMLNPISGIDLVYCSADNSIATVDANGLITGVSAGSTEIKVCNGFVATYVYVKVN